MKKILLSMSTAVALVAGEWYTATSVTAGAKFLYLNQLPSSFDARIEQYFIHSDFSALYFKAGYFHEQLKAWEAGEIDIAHSAQLGVGINVLSLGGFFVDAGLSGAYRFAYNTTETEDGSSQYTEGPVIPYGEVGVGISLGQFTLRSDFMLGLLAGSVNLLDSDGVKTDTKSYDQFHVNVGLAYWWY